MGYIIDALRQVGSALVMAEEIIVITSAVLGALAMFFVLNYIYEVIACWRIFKKAGESGWKSLIPGYSNYIRYRISWRPLWFWVSALLLAGSIALELWGVEGALWDGISMGIGAVGTLIHVIRNFRLGRAFGRGVPFCLGLVVFPPLFTLILGLGGSEYRGKREQPEAPAVTAEKEG